MVDLVDSNDDGAPPPPRPAKRVKKEAVDVVGR